MKKFSVEGFKESVVIVRDPKVHLDVWLDVGGWELRHEGDVAHEILAAWGVEGASGKEWLLAHPDCHTGFMRLVQLDNAGVQTHIRADDQCWDSGGIFDFNVRVLDIAKKSHALRNLGWHGASLPTQWDFGAVNVKEWLPKGPDNIRLALIERMSPPLQGFDHLREFSQVFNSSQIVRDMDAAVAFYRDVLGFELVYHYDSPAIPAGVNVFGLPVSLTNRVGMNINIMHPQGKMEGSIELVCLPGAEGLDLSQDARPPNLGMAVLRFPTRGMDALEQRLVESNWSPACSRRQVVLQPYGLVDLIAVRAPDGAWLEFFEVL